VREEENRSETVKTKRKNSGRRAGPWNCCMMGETSVWKEPT